MTYSKFQFALRVFGCRGSFVILRSRHKRHRLPPFLSQAKLEAFLRVSEPLPQPREETPLQRDLAELRQDLEKAGKFRSNPLFEASKLLYIHATLFFGVLLLVKFHPMFWATFAGVMLIAMSWHQSGWVAHDYSHHSVFFQSPRLNDWVGIWLGCLQGYELGWWKGKFTACFFSHACYGATHRFPSYQLVTVVASWSDLC